MEKVICQDCGSAQVYADHRGYWVCRECGLVKPDWALYNSKRRLMKGDNGEILRQNGIIVDAGTLIGTTTERNHVPHYAHLQRLQNRVIERPKTKAFAIFSQLRTNFEISLPLVLFFKDFQRFYPKIQKGSKCRSLPLLCATLFYIKCKKHAIKIELKEMLAFYQLSKRDYFDCVKVLTAIYPDFMQNTMKDLTHNVFKLVSRLQSEFELPTKVMQISKLLIKRYRPYLGEKPEIIAGSAVGIALKLTTVRNAPSNFAISKELTVTASTIYSRVKHFQMKKIHPDCLQKIKALNQAEKNPPSLLFPDVSLQISS